MRLQARESNLKTLAIIQWKQNSILWTVVIKKETDNWSDNYKIVLIGFNRHMHMKGLGDIYGVSGLKIMW